MAYDVAVSPDGTKVFAAGYTQPHLGGPTYATVAYDARTGRRLWSATFDRRRTYETIYAVAVSSDSSIVFVSGSVSETDFSYLTIAYDARTGQELWKRAFAHIAGSIPYLAVDPGGSAVYVGGVTLAGTHSDYLLLSYDPSSGQDLWRDTYGAEDTIDDAWGIAASPDGLRVYLTGVSIDPSGETHALTVAFRAADGAVDWAARSSNPGSASEWARGAAVSPDGSTVYVTAKGGTERLGNAFVTHAYDAATGSSRWAAAYPLSTCCTDTPIAPAVNPTGSAIYVTGVHDSDYATVAYEASTGDQLWSTTYDGPEQSTDNARDIGVDPSGSTVVVTGSSVSSRGWDMATVAYDAATGTQTGQARYAGPSRDEATALAMHPFRSVAYVSGTGHVSYQRTMDMITIAYAW